MIKKMKKQHINNVFAKILKSITRLYTIIYNNTSSLSNSKILAAISLIIMNIGSKYITVKFNKSTEAFFKYIMSKKLFIFTICWMATKDIFISFLISLIFFMITEHLLNDQSKFCMIPNEYLNKIYNVVDTNQDGEIDNAEIKHALKILQTHIK
jgi:hypothetical protein